MNKNPHMLYRDTDMVRIQCYPVIRTGGTYHEPKYVVDIVKFHSGDNNGVEHETILRLNEIQLKSFIKMFDEAIPMDDIVLYFKL